MQKKFGGFAGIGGDHETPVRHLLASGLKGVGSVGKNFRSGGRKMLRQSVAVCREGCRSLGREWQKLQGERRACGLRSGIGRRRFFENDVDVGATETKRTDGSAADLFSSRERDELVGNHERTAGKVDFGIWRFEMKGCRYLLVMQDEGRFDQAGNSGGIGGMTDVAFDGTKVAELFLVRLTLKDFAQRFEFNRIANGGSCAVRLNVADGLDGNVGIGLGEGNGFGLAVHAGSQEGSGAGAVVVLAGAANQGIDGIAIGESIG